MAPSYSAGGETLADLKAAGARWAFDQQAAGADRSSAAALALGEMFCVGLWRGEKPYTKPDPRIFSRCGRRAFGQRPGGD